MKKCIYTFVLLTLLMSLCSCVTIRKKYNRYADIENIDSIEVYFIDFSYEKEIYNIPSNIKPLKTIKKEQFEEVIIDLEKLEYTSKILIIAANDPNFNLYGFVIKIVYRTGIYQLVSNSGTVYTYDSNDQIDAFFGTVEIDTWNKVIIKYIGEDIFKQYSMPF